MGRMDIVFRRLADADLPRLHAWLNEPGVVAWWEGDDVSWEAVVRDYGPANPDPAEHWIASAGGRDVGWIQCWAVADEPDECAPWFALGVDEATAAGIDYLVGEPGDRGTGLGSAMIRAFVDDVVFGRHPRWQQAAADPLAANVASWRALENAGFRLAGIVDAKDGPARLMVADRGLPPAAPEGDGAPT